MADFTRGANDWNATIAASNQNRTLEIPTANKYLDKNIKLTLSGLVVRYGNTDPGSATDGNIYFKVPTSSVTNGTVEPSASGAVQGALYFKAI